MNIFVLFFVSLICLQAGCTVLIGINTQIYNNSIVFGTYDTSTGDSVVINTLKQWEAFATGRVDGDYNPTNNQLTFVCNYFNTEYLLTIDATTGDVVYSAPVNSTPEVYRIMDPKYDPLSSILYAQVSPGNNERQLVIIDPKTAQVEKVLFTFPSLWGIPVYGSTFDYVSKIYYTFGSFMYGNRFLVGIDVQSGDVVFNVTLQMDQGAIATSHVNTFAYNHNTESMYAVAYNNVTQTNDVCEIDMTTGDLIFFPIWQSNNNQKNVIDIIVDETKNVLYIYWQDTFNRNSARHMYTFDLATELIVDSQNLPQNAALEIMAIKQE